MMFSEFVEFIKSNEGAPPSAAEINHDAPSAIIGAALPRIDGPLKTTGKALYASEVATVRAVPLSRMRLSTTGASMSLQSSLKPSSRPARQQQPFTLITT